MNKRENLLSLLNRTGYDDVVVNFELCPFLVEKFKSICKEEDYRDFFGFSYRELCQPKIELNYTQYNKYYKSLNGQTEIDEWGVCHEHGSESAFHMTRLISPLAECDNLQELLEYPVPNYDLIDVSMLKKESDNIKARELVSFGRMGQTIWERSWMIRGMENLMADMMTDEENAQAIFDKVTQCAIKKAVAYANAQVDVLWVGDDVGMQSTLMMSRELYRKWLKPRMKQVIDSAKSVNKDIKIMYHSCGYIYPLIEDLIEIGVDILNPIQPECMDFAVIHKEFGDRLSFHGTIGTQSVLPLGSIEDVKSAVKRNLDIAGSKGGLICCPTHLLEPDVPIENIIAYIDACKEYKNNV